MTNKMKTKYQKGSITFGLPVLLSIIGFMGAGYGLFYSALSTADTERNEIKAELKEDVADSRERIRALEVACDTIKINTTEIRDDIKLLLQR